MAYRMGAILMILSLLQGHSLLQAFQMLFLYSCAAVDKVSTDVACHVVCLQ